MMLDDDDEDDDDDSQDVVMTGWRIGWNDGERKGDPGLCS